MLGLPIPPLTYRTVLGQISPAVQYNWLVLSKLRDCKVQIHLLAPLSFILMVNSPALASRHIDVEVIVDGKVVMTAAYSDDGRRNADEVWNGVGQLHFQHHDKFAVELTKTSDGRFYEIRRKGTLRIQFGGQYSFNKIQFYEDKTTRGKEKLMVNPTHLKRWFNSRMIRRRDANGLNDD